MPHGSIMQLSIYTGNKTAAHILSATVAVTQQTTTRFVFRAACYRLCSPGTWRCLLKSDF